LDAIGVPKSEFESVLCITTIRLYQFSFLALHKMLDEKKIQALRLLSCSPKSRFQPTAEDRRLLDEMPRMIGWSLFSYWMSRPDDQNWVGEMIWSVRMRVN
jgi:hypothetical protein